MMKRKNVSGSLGPHLNAYAKRIGAIPKNFRTLIVESIDKSDDGAVGYGFHSQQYALHTLLNTAIDKLAEQLTGDPRFFASPGHSIGGGLEATSPRQERELRWQELRLKYR